MVKKIVQNFYQLSDENDKVEADEDDDPDDIDEIFKIEGNLFNYEIPLWDLNVTMVQLTNYRESTSWHADIFYDHKLCNELADGKLKVKALMHKAKVEESWGDATPGVIKFYAWLESSFENFHELDHDGPYANIKTEKTYDPYLDFNHIFGRNYGANNVGDTQDCQECKEEHNKHAESSKPTHDPSICQVRRFGMIKYPFDADDEYVAIKEHECSDHSKTNIDACQAYRELFRVMDEGWIDLAVKESTIWYTLKKMCVELVRAILTPRQHTFAQELKLENHPEKHIREVLRSNSISHFL
ncbi:hypothetical protein Tco_1476282 [Tanacetum coccineum]